MSHHDRGATLIEVIMAIVLIGILVPAVFATISAIDRGLQRSRLQEQAYEIAMRTVEQIKIERKADIDQSVLYLPPGFEVTVTEISPTDPSVPSALTQYEVTVERNSVVLLVYNFYYWNDGS